MASCSTAKIAAILLLAALPAAAGAVAFDQGVDSQGALKEIYARPRLEISPVMGSGAPHEADEQAPKTPSFDELTKMSQADLNALFGKSPAGPIPKGGSQGKVVLFGRTPMSHVTAWLAGLLWQGKVFEMKDGKNVLVNKVLGFKAIRAKVFHGKGWFDDNQSIILDYKDTSLVAHFFVDEMRLVAPDIYLGRFYKRTPFGKIHLANFVLSFEKPAPVSK